MTEKKSIISSHFDHMIASSDEKNLMQYGSLTNPRLLRLPYIYIEKKISKFFDDNKDIEIMTLDYCCGSGIYSIIPIMMNSYVYGIDISLKSVSLAKKRTSSLTAKNNFKFEQMDAEKLEFDNDKFDLIMSYNSLSYLNLNKSYSELSRVMSSRGKIIIMDSIGHNIFFKINRLLNVNKWANRIAKDIQILRKKDIDLATKFFKLEEIRFFGFFSLAFYYLEKKFGFKVHDGLINSIDSLILKIPFSYLIAFKYVAIYSKKNKN